MPTESDHDAEPDSGDAATRTPDLAKAREGDGQEYLDRDKLDFNPDDGLYSGTAIDGSSEIPGPHDDDGEHSVTERAAEISDDGSADESSPEPAGTPSPEPGVGS